MDVRKIWDSVEFLYAKLLGEAPPPPVVMVLAVLIAAALVLGGVVAVLKLLNALKEETKKLFPLFPSPEDQRRVNRRRLFAQHIQAEVRRLNSLESWQDYRFTELEAEVEAEGGVRRSTLARVLRKSPGRIRRERSLSNALAQST